MSDSEMIVVTDDNHHDHVFPNNNNHISSDKCACRPFWNSATMEWIHDNRFGLEPSRIDVIGQNGNDGDHYQLYANDKQEGGTHYKEMDIEPWDVIDSWSLEQRIGAYRAGILKYVMRLGSKDELIKEAKKCRHYAEKLVEVLEGAKDEI